MRAWCKFHSLLSISCAVNKKYYKDLTLTEKLLHTEWGDTLCVSAVYVNTNNGKYTQKT